MNPRHTDYDSYMPYCLPYEISNRVASVSCSVGLQRRSESLPTTSAMPPKADIRLHCNICRNGPCMDGARGARANLTLSAKRSGAAMYTACFRLEDYLGRDAAAVAAGPDVIR